MENKSYVEGEISTNDLIPSEGIITNDPTLEINMYSRNSESKFFSSEQRSVTTMDTNTAGAKLIDSDDSKQEKQTHGRTRVSKFVCSTPKKTKIRPIIKILEKNTTV